MDPGVIAAELRNHDARLTANHDSIAVLRERTAAHDTKINVIATEIRETRTDIGEMGERLDRVGRNFYVAASAMFGLMLSVIGLIAAVLTGS